MVERLSLEYRLWKIRTKERVTMKIAWMLPRSVAMWAYVRVGAHATTGKYENTVVPELSMLDALGRWPD